MRKAHELRQRAQARARTWPDKHQTLSREQRTAEIKRLKLSLIRQGKVRPETSEPDEQQAWAEFRASQK